MVGSAAVNGRGYLDADTSVVVTVLGLMVVAFAICNLFWAYGSPQGPADGLIDESTKASVVSGSTRAAHREARRLRMERPVDARLHGRYD